MDTPLSAQAIPDRIERVETSVKLTKKGSRSLLERMSDQVVPGVSVAVINNYQLEWARGYGVREMGTMERVDAETLFQACSISKPVTAVAALRLVEQGRLDLDADINTFLTSWQIPANGHWQPQVTLRQLVSHTAGISVPWFVGYHIEQDIPTLREILESEQPANSYPVRVTSIPGLRYRYSGGGFLILQQALMDVTGRPFPDLMRDLLFIPLAMQHSTYEQPLSVEQRGNAASGHRGSGKVVPGKWHIYPELAAAGLWTTPSDLARLALSLQRARAGEQNQILSPALVEQLLTPRSKADNDREIGLGVFIEGQGKTARFGHGGDNTGFACLWVSLMNEGRGCVVMTNSDNGWTMENELMRAISRVYNWPAVSRVKHHIASTPETPPTEDHRNYMGEYELRPGFSLTITIHNDHLYLRFPDQSPIELLPGNNATYMLAGLDDTVTFVRNEAGEVQSLILHVDATEELAVKGGIL